MPVNPSSRRTFVAGAGGFAAGVFATSRFGGLALAQDATPPDGAQPVGFVSMRIRMVETREQREAVNGFVLESFVGDVAALDGYQGYLLGDVIDEPTHSLTVIVFDEAGQEAGFNDVAGAFVESIADEVVVAGTEHWSGELRITGNPELDAATSAATPATVSAPMSSGYVAVRIHTSLPGTDPLDFVPLATSEFMPIVAGLDGFLGYLWFPVEGGFAAITLYDSEESAEASNEAAREWAAEFLTEYTDDNPEIVNAHIVYADMPILG